MPQYHLNTYQLMAIITICSYIHIWCDKMWKCDSDHGWSDHGLLWPDFPLVSFHVASQSGTINILIRFTLRLRMYESLRISKVTIASFFRTSDILKLSYILKLRVNPINILFKSLKSTRFSAMEYFNIFLMFCILGRAEKTETRKNSTWVRLGWLC